MHYDILHDYIVWNPKKYYMQAVIFQYIMQINTNHNGNKYHGLFYLERNFKHWQYSKLVKQMLLTQISSIILPLWKLGALKLGKSNLSRGNGKC